MEINRIYELSTSLTFINKLKLNFCCCQPFKLKYNDINLCKTRMEN